ncbi:MAG: DUF5916 domain-containing protein [Bacteroidota bacterium]|nr:carbohydrate binding family 9 domain-containing protein [Rhodothermia bacterium]MCS7155567.1 carbohydrate binding family 9 domain-containing protein [Bacteroidota bacterium]MDW8137293.1 DUF5916 domain-containing protein [Bacteroidota bacterium]MDW8284837.1 DUF5916 domain-containing protein [Bacteroidota bacterium]
MMSIQGIYGIILSLLLTGEADRIKQNASASSQRTVQAVRTATAPRIDGKPEEPIWQEAPPTTDFIQYEPVEGAPATERTEVRLLYDDNNLYIAAWLYDQEPARIVRRLGRRDDWVQADWFYVAIDSYLDRRTAYVFGVNAAGTLADGIITNDGQGGGRGPGGFGSMDRSWNAVWEAEVALHEWGWAVEMRIPYSQLRFPKLAQHTWGINFRRQIPRKAEVSEWVMVPRTVRGYVSHFGLLEGIRQIEPRGIAQLLPYTSSKLQTQPAVPTRLPQDVRYDGGVDAKLGLASNILLDLTLNPDFGQVESDPAELNLTTFETFFPERRPFFLEGVQIFDYTFGGLGDALLYTRRIGSKAPIIGAAKLTGRSAGGFSFGLIEAVTGNRFKPAQNYAALRLKQELFGNAYVGVMATSYAELPQSQGASWRHNVAGGFDWDFRLWQNRYQFTGAAAFTDRQVGSGRRTGYALHTGFDKRSGVWTFFSGFRMYSPDFNPNDLGRLRRPDLINLSLGLGHLVNNNQPFGPFRRASMRAFFWNSWNFARRPLGSNLNTNLNGEFHNYWNANLNLSLNNLFRGYDDRESRGNGLYRPPMSWSVRTEVRTDPRRPIQLELSAAHGRDMKQRREWEVGLDLNLRLGTRLELSPEVSLGRLDRVEAWVRNATYVYEPSSGWHIESGRTRYRLSFPDAEQEQIFRAALGAALPQVQNGRYYLSTFSDRTTRQVDISLRGSVLLTRELSLQLYSQLFTARGRYEAFRVLLDPDRFAPVPGYPIVEDFYRRNFNLNAVLRWEFRPGSVLYIVWTQQRQGNGQTFFVSDWRSLQDTFQLEPANLFMVKLNYLFMR